MPIVTKETTVYICTDGKEFLNRKEAIKHEAYRELLKIAPSGGAIYSDDVVEFIINKWTKIKEIMGDDYE